MLVPAFLPTAAAVFSLARIAVAQVARFPCEYKYVVAISGGVYSNCGQYLNSTGGGGPDAVRSTRLKSEGYTPLDAPRCIGDPKDPPNNGFCGFYNAECAAAGAGRGTEQPTDPYHVGCDNGWCDMYTHKCRGWFRDDCSGDDSRCLGYSYCNRADGTLTPSGRCGASGAYCNTEAAMAYPIGSSEWHESAAHVCYSGYCSSETLECTIKSLANFVGGCSLDGDAQCPDDTTCVDGTCVPTVGPSQRAARQRRDVLCPAPFVSCTILESSTGFECIDTQSNIEQCGACAKDGGVDCSALPGVESVGCVAGQCEVWACTEGFEHDVAAGSCVKRK